MEGLNIKRFRKVKKLTQDDLAKKLGVTRQAICMWEVNKRELRASTLRKVARALGVTISELMKPQDQEIAGQLGEFDIKQGTSNQAIIKKEGGMAKKQSTAKSTFELKAPEAKKVALTGDFLSWNEKGIALKKSKGGLWKGGVDLKPGRYEYKFIVDGQWWTDPQNNNRIRNSLGSENSVREISC